MRLQIEQELQTVFDLAQKAIGIVENAILLIGEASHPFQSGQRQQGIALPKFRQVAAVEQLQELEGELNIADAAASGLDLGGADAGLAGLVLDAPLHHLDLVDLGETEIFTVDKRFNGLQELLPQG